MATVTTPVAGFTGTVAGVEFTNGKGTTSSAPALAYFRRHGYTVTEPAKKTPKKPAEPDTPTDGE